MASLGRISNSIVTGVNENTLALASLNFDFSLVRLQVPEEYNAVGRCLAAGRRENAEYGMAHRTARKLGALFEAVIPSMPKLITAYGKRASEILDAPGINPSGDQERHGPFTAFVGADATSIWAAATSGTASIAVHLLACIIARAFRDPAEAVSVWVEIVMERQKDIERAAQDGLFTAAHLGMINAASQQFPREELRQWDANARAWLQSSDAAMRKQHIQLRLILRNVNLPVSAGARLYADVIRAWTQAMNGVERLLGGEPQSVTDGAILLAISAWHLYPNLLVLGKQTTEVDFSDPAMQPSGVLTIGITNEGVSAANKEGIYWSLALSHYRYYGKPVRTNGEVDDRLTIEELQMAAFGSILRTWNAPRDGALQAAEWFIALWDCVNNAKATLSGPEWLKVLVEAAHRLLETDETERKAQLSLIDFGYRRGRKFFVKQGPRHKCLPWFGLRSPHILNSLARETAAECGFQYLREVARAGGLRRDEALITHVSVKKTEQYHEYMTAIDSINVRRRTQQSPPESDQPGLVDDTDAEGKEYADEHENDGYLKCRHARWFGEFDLQGKRTINRTVRVRRSFSAYETTDEELIDDVVLTTPTRLSTERRRNLYGRLEYESFDINPTLVFTDCRAELPVSLGLFQVSPVQFTKVFGDTLGNFRLWITRPGHARAKHLDTDIRQMQTGNAQPLVEIHDAIALLKDGEMNRVLLWQYLEGVEPYEPETLVKSVLDLMREERERCERTINSLRSLAVAKRIYGDLDGATVSASIIERGISDAKWGSAGRASLLNRSIVFSCIAMMETGEVNLEARNLGHVIALSAGSSLFVLSKILTDPFVEKPDYSVTRIIGNVGRAGISLLVPPAAGPLTRPLSSSIRAVDYAEYDGSHTNKFGGTSLHLSFTTHEFPVDYGSSGIIDHQVFFVESVVSVHDGGKWVADLDVFKILAKDDIARIRVPRRKDGQPCCHTSETVTKTLQRFVAIDTWEEILDEAPGMGLVRSHKNWAARFAASVILSQGCTSDSSDEDDASENEDTPSTPRKFAVLESRDDVCWVCTYNRLRRLAIAEADSPFYLVT